MQPVWKDRVLQDPSPKELAIEAVKRCGHLLAWQPAQAFRADKEVVLAAVGKHGNALQFADATLTADKEVVLAAVRSNGHALRFAAAALQADKEVVMAAVTLAAAPRALSNPLKFADDALRAEKEVVMAAVCTHGSALEFAAAALKADREVVMAAVRTCSSALRHADVALHSDTELIMAAASGTGTVFLEVDAAALQGLMDSLSGRIVLSITTLSGKSCCCLVSPDVEELDISVRQELLRGSSGLLGLDSDTVLEAGVLVDVKSAAALDDDAALRALRPGEIHELQLVMQGAKRRRL